MPDLLVRNIDLGTAERLKQRARLAGRSLQAELNLILSNAASENLCSPRDLAREIRERHGKDFLDSSELIREDRER